MGNLRKHKIFSDTLMKQWGGYYITLDLNWQQNSVRNAALRMFKVIMDTVADVWLIFKYMWPGRCKKEDKEKIKEVTSSSTTSRRRLTTDNLPVVYNSHRRHLSTDTLDVSTQSGGSDSDSFQD